MRCKVSTAHGLRPNSATLILTTGPDDDEPVIINLDADAHGFARPHLWAAALRLAAGQLDVLVDIGRWPGVSLTEAEFDRELTDEDKAIQAAAILAGRPS